MFIFETMKVLPEEALSESPTGAEHVASEALAILTGPREDYSSLSLLSK